IQTTGRAARNVEGKVIMYADRITDSMKRAIGETNRRRQIQKDYNERHGIIPRTVQKAVRDVIEITLPAEVAEEKGTYSVGKPLDSMNRKELEKLINRLEQEMRQSAKDLAFEKAAGLRDLIMELRKELSTRSRRKSKSIEQIEEQLEIDAEMDVTGRHRKQSCVQEQKKKSTSRRGTKLSSGGHGSTI
ncbi:MAG: UvrB/UvrC motif-containing protein, partial [Syntrophaceticus sp.]|nr:UvrB/UvrC motif-containing protein [Syntrophaceticus sp.]